MGKWDKYEEPAADKWGKYAEGAAQSVVAPPDASPSASLSWSDVPATALSNIPKSAYEYGGNVVQAVVHPLDTVIGVHDIAQGGLGIGNEEQTKKWASVRDFFTERYGTEDGFKKALAEDPVGVIADLSSVLTGGGGVAARVPGIVGRAGKFISKAGAAIEPASVAAKAISPAVKLAGEVGSGTLGFTTGAGKASIKQAFKGGEDFTEAMRGRVGGEDLLTNTKGALQAIKDDRAADYQGRLATISQNTTQLNYAPIETKLVQLEKAFNIKRTPILDDAGNPTGKFDHDFSRSTLNKNAHNDVKEIIDRIESWSTDPAYQNAIGLDILKRQLDDFYSDSKNSRAFVTSLRNTVKDTIVRAVPEYATMTKNYETASKFITEIERTLSTGNKATIDTGIRKLMTSLKDNYDFRKELIAKVDAAAGTSLQSQIAGVNLSGLTPQGFMGKSFDVGILLGALMGADPKIAFALTAASPRVVGEFVNAFGKMYQTQKQIQSIINPSVRNAAFQAGRETTLGYE